MTNGMLLLAGCAPEEPSTAALLRVAAGQGYGAVVARLGDASVEDLTATADELGIALLGVHAEVEWLHLATMATAVLDAVVRESTGAAAAPGDLFGLANAVAAAVGGSTAIEDFSQRILAYSTLPGQPIDKDRRDGILGRQVPDLPGNEALYRELYRSTGVIRFPAAGDDLPRIAVTVRAGSEPIGSIWVIDATDSLGEEVDASLMAAAEMAALQLLRARSAGDLARHRRGELVRAVLNGETPAAVAMERLGMDVSGRFAVLALTAVEGESVPVEAARLMDLMMLRLEPRLGLIGTCLLGSTFYVVAAGTRVQDEAQLSRMAEGVREAAARTLHLKLAVAVGPLVSAPAQIEPARRDADRVLSLLRARPELGPVGSAADLGDQLALAHLGRMLKGDPVLVSTKGRAILAHDAEFGTAYGALFSTWLDAGRDIASTARRLEVHPNTVRYRLRRAIEMFGIDVDDAEQMLVLWWTLRVSGEP